VLTAVPGVRVGHWTNAVARTGCTVVLFPAGTVASGEVRGGAPATRETDLLLPGRFVETVDAVLLTGGSAFGLAAADGVVRWCEERGIGHPTGAGPVPIVVGLGLYDLLVGDGSVRPGAAEGYAACEAATAGPVATGSVGAGAGATVGKWRGRGAARAAGLGAAVVERDGLVVAALVAVNAFGDLAGDADDAPRVSGAPDPEAAFGNTTIGVVATNGRIDKVGCHLLAQSGHDGFARALDPAHTRVDGDAIVVAATGDVDASLDAARVLTATVVTRAIRDAVRGPDSPTGR
jgi:L-aminopeptidase/D-esterase-like protein